MKKVTNLTMTLAFLGAVGMAAPGCVIRARPAEPVVATSYYTPLYYNGYVVYYDTLGRPMYYAGGVRYYVPSTYVYYGRLRTHYLSHRVYYNRWYRARGHRYRRYRRARYRRGRAVRRGHRRNVRRNRRSNRRQRRRQRRHR